MGGEDQGAHGIAILPAPPAQEDSPCPSGPPHRPTCSQKMGAGGSQQSPRASASATASLPLPCGPGGALDLCLPGAPLRAPRRGGEAFIAGRFSDAGQ